MTKFTILNVMLVLSVVGCKHDPLPERIANLERQVAQLQASQLEQEKYNEKQKIRDNDHIKWEKQISEVTEKLLIAAKKPKTVASGWHDCHVTKVEHNGDFGDTIWRTCTDANGDEHTMNY